MRQVVFLLLALPGSVHADYLVLSNRSIIEGRVEKVRHDGSIVGYDLTDANGERTYYARDEVKRFRHECIKSLADVNDDIRYLSTILKDVLSDPLPAQIDINMNMDSAWVGYWSELGGSMHRESVASDRFVDQWARFAATIEAVKRDPRVRRLLDVRKGSGSLREFAMYPPREAMGRGQVVRDFLGAFAICLKQGARTSRMVRGLHRNVAKNMASVQKKQQIADLARQLTSIEATVRERRAAVFAQSVADRALIDVREKFRVRVMKVDTMINDFAMEREVVRRQIAAVADYMETYATRP